MTRCAPGRFPDRTKKWTDEVRCCHDPYLRCTTGSQETRLICESRVSSQQDLMDLLQVLNSRKDSGRLHSVDSLRRKVLRCSMSNVEGICHLGRVSWCVRDDAKIKLINISSEVAASRHCDFNFGQRPWNGSTRA